MTDSELPERPPIASAPVSVLLVVGAPTNVATIVGRWLEFLPTLGRPYEFLVVDDGSNEAAAAEVRRLAKEEPRLKAVRRPGPVGIGATLRAGLAVAQQPLVFTVPCLPDYTPDTLKLFLEAIDKVDIVVGCRTAGKRPLWWRVVGRLYRAVVRVVVGIPLDPPAAWLGWTGWFQGKVINVVFGGGASDVDCLCRLYRRSVFPRIPIQSDGPFALAEILAKATFQGCYLDEVELPVPAVRQPGPRWREAWRVFQRPDFGPAVPGASEPPPIKSKRTRRRAGKK